MADGHRSEDGSSGEDVPRKEDALGRAQGPPPTPLPPTNLEWPWLAVVAAIFVSILPIILEGSFNLARNQALRQLISPGTTLYSLFAVSAVSLAQIVKNEENRPLWMVPCFGTFVSGIFAVTVSSGPYPFSWEMQIFGLAVVATVASVFVAWCPWRITPAALRERFKQASANGRHEDGLAAGEGGSDGA